MEELSHHIIHGRTSKPKLNRSVQSRQDQILVMSTKLHSSKYRVAQNAML